MKNYFAENVAIILIVTVIVVTRKSNSLLASDKIDKGVTVREKRNANDCKDTEELGECCPPTPCGPTCENQRIPYPSEVTRKLIHSVCIEKCVCTAGYVRRMSDLTCVSLSECPDNSPKLMSKIGKNKKCPLGRFLQGKYNSPIIGGKYNRPRYFPPPYHGK